MTFTLVILATLILLGIINWFMMKGMREQEQVLEANVDRIHAELQESINIFNRYRN